MTIKLGHKKGSKQLAALNLSRQQLPYCVQEIRERAGALIPRPQQLVLPSTFAQRRLAASVEMRVFLSSTHLRAGKHSLARVAEPRGQR